MSKVKRFQLQATSLKNIPLQKYGDDFSFIINGEEFKTSQLVADILSPTINKQHLVDPTVNLFVITTKHKGNFTHVLNLASFNELSVPEDEIPFFFEIFSILDNKSIKSINKSNDQLEFSDENVLDLLKEYDKNGYLQKYGVLIDDEIDFVSSHFCTFCDKYDEELRSLNYDLLYRIISNGKLHLNDEDQLIKFINKIYQEKRNSLNVSNLYEFVLFENVETNSIEEFINIYDYNDLTHETWNAIMNRLKQPITKNNSLLLNRYEVKVQEFESKSDKDLNGIFKHFSNQSTEKFENKVKITSSSFYKNYVPLNVVDFGNSSQWFRTDSSDNSIKSEWICFQFVENKVITSKYQIKSIPFGPNAGHLKSWIVEGSNDKLNWEKLDEQNNCLYLNGNCYSHIFDVANPNSKSFSFIRVRLTGPNWSGRDTLMIGSFELYGKLI